MSFQKNEQASFWNIELIEDYLKEAANTLKRLPKVQLQSRITYWPEVVRSAAELFIGERHAKNSIAAPSPAAIDRMDMALVWLLPLNQEQRQIIWARINGISWRKLEDIDGRSHVTLRKIYQSGLKNILQQLTPAIPLSNSINSPAFIKI